MNADENSFFRDQLLGILFGVSIAALFVACMVQSDGDVKRAAVKHGYAEYRANVKGESEWHWKNDPIESAEKKQP